jgi:transcriptional regulator with XRE-family HTH domain
MGNAADEDFGRGMRALRLEKGLTQEALAERSDLSVDAVRRIEHGAFSPSLKTVRKLAAGLKMSLKRLFQSLQRGQRTLHDRACDFLAGRTAPEIAQAWRVIRAMFRKQ